MRSVLIFGSPGPDRFPLGNRGGACNRCWRDRIINLPIWACDGNGRFYQEPLVGEVAGVGSHANTREIVPLPRKLLASAHYFVNGLTEGGERRVHLDFQLGGLVDQLNDTAQQQGTALAELTSIECSGGHRGGNLLCI